ncbi:3'-5' exonuclease [Sphaerotilus sp.]|uniref:3'-5' exonuclease n=1 Tax=Sphaerotilus sp. TaxID=2093942 RepID=UPI00286E0E24|nr:3'-5' exonuclease [Sphaerotilus sp.]
MAQFPQGYRQIEQRCNAGERRVLQQLKQCLDDGHLVWHNVPIGPRARQPDFVVLGPRMGLLLLEVKDWRCSTVLHATPDAVTLHTERGPVTEHHPLRQARDYAMELVDLVQRDPALVHDDGPYRGRLLFPYGWGAVFSGMQRSEVAQRPGFDAVFPPAHTLLRDDLDDSVDPDTFQQRLLGLFTVHYPHTLTPAQRDRVRWHLFPELRLNTEPVEPDTEPPPVPDLLQVMDLPQEQIARRLGSGHRVVHGVAGSGKTMVLVLRAQMLAAAATAEHPVLVLCYNRARADQLDALVRQRPVGDRVQVRTFHRWCQELLRRRGIDLPAEPGSEAFYAELPRTVAQAITDGRIPAGGYSAVLIDEAHDFDDDWLRTAACMVSPHTRSLLVLYDDAQSIYQTSRRRFSFASVGIQAQGRTSVLRLNYRNTAEVLTLALACAQGLLLPGEPARLRPDDEVQTVPPATSGRHGPKPVLLLAQDPADEAEQIAERIGAARKRGVAWSDIAVLCRTRAQLAPIAQALQRRGWPVESMGETDFRRFDWQQSRIRLLTLHSAKGLEFALVLVAGLQALPWRGESLDDAARLLYVAMTRATHALVLSACGASPIVERVQQALSGAEKPLATPA